MSEKDIGKIEGLLEGLTKRFDDFLKSNSAQHKTIFGKIDDLDKKATQLDSYISKTIQDVSFLREIVEKSITEKLFEILRNKTVLTLLSLIVILGASCSVGIDKAIEILIEIIVGR